MARRYRPRKEFKFWLYHDLDEDKRLMEFIRFCKTTQQFACMVRNGLRIMWSLGEGNTAVLYELFPWIQTQSTLTTSAPDTENLERQIADLKRIMLEQGTAKTPHTTYPMLQSSIAAPAVTLKTAPVADASAIADNFLAFIQ
jgi:hypothetical protein